MMPVTVEKLGDEPIMIATLSDPFVAKQDAPFMFSEFARLRGDYKGMLYFAIDVSAASITFSDVVITLGEAAQAVRTVKGEHGESISRPMLVGAGGLIEMASKAMNQVQYGRLRAPVFTSIDDALKYARDEIAASVSV